MLASRAKKENVILIPNKDKLPIGKIKDVNKFLNMVSTEYGIEEDMAYFTIEKEKYVMVFKLQYIPRGVSELHSTNAKKFIVYELIKNSHGSVMKIDQDLNKRAMAINDLLNAIDDTSKETITAKLQSMFDIPGELDYLLDQLLTDPQYNSFKYTVLDSSKTSCLLCVNGYGLFIRSLEPPYDVLRQLSWSDVVSIKVKGNKLIFRKKEGESEEIGCITKKTVLGAHGRLTRYLSFVNNKDTAETRTKTGWFGSVAHRIRQSFSRRPRRHDSEPPTSAHSAPNKSTSSHYRENAPPNSTVPGSSVVSEDCLDNVGSMMEPSIKTNSTHDVSLGSASSFRPGTTSLVRLSGPDDRMSVKTTSTYEVNLDTISTQRTLSNGSRTDPDSSAGQTQARKSPPLSQLKDSVFSETMAESCDDGESAEAECGQGLNVRAEVATQMCEMHAAFDPEVHETCVSTIEEVKVKRDSMTLVKAETEEDDSGTMIMEATMVGDQPMVVRQSPVSAMSVAHSVDGTEIEDALNLSLPMTEMEYGGDNSVIYDKKSLPSPSKTADVQIVAQRPSRIPSVSSVKERPTESQSPTTEAPSPSDKENYNSMTAISDNGHDGSIMNTNFSRFENEEYTVDSKTTFTSVSTTGDSITKKFTKTEISSVKASGIPAPRQYKTTTTITSTVKKPRDGSKSPIMVAGQGDGADHRTTSAIPRMASK